MPIQEKRSEAAAGSVPSLGKRLRIKEVADLLGVNVRTVQRRIAEGILPSQRFGRCVLVPEAAVVAYLSRSGSGASP